VCLSMTNSSKNTAATKPIRTAREGSAADETIEVQAPPRGKWPIVHGSKEQVVKAPAILAEWNCPLQHSREGMECMPTRFLLAATGFSHHRGSRNRRLRCYSKSGWHKALIRKETYECLIFPMRGEFMGRRSSLGLILLILLIRRSGRRCMAAPRKKRPRIRFAASPMFRSVLRELVSSLQIRINGDGRAVSRQTFRR